MGRVYRLSLIVIGEILLHMNMKTEHIGIDLMRLLLIIGMRLLTPLILYQMQNHLRLYLILFIIIS
jgi:hypothetical protein